ncbi:GSCFA domain-containing protein [Oceanihabitans sp. IOP_32]|uniref:GSCFA domain-containing protein n=1 Tax=Oceanihabitans sp. IOP_32 TaxID=2529032 RepID=UPI0012938AA4|nr:GSCFA domain-containing protein [Oceanihabitans sp. IOP_32]QFZ55129.1 GSCFA domain-containing protein [Oceanihabitans sp. IOP_32]
MNLQTKIKLTQQSQNLIDYNSNLLLLGSCFVENIGKKLDHFKFNKLQNPLGILFNPKVIETLVFNAVNQKEYREEDVFFHNEQWHCFEAHSRLSNTSKENLLRDLNTAIQLTNQQIQKTTHIVITLGTAWIYNALETGKTVANCHKVPQEQFRREKMTVNAICKSLNHTVALVRRVNKNASMVFTVSPVRHLKDGFVENTLSKAHLITALHQIINHDEGLYYFPSYEIMMDELRDYRFYAEDMVHPNQVAINYIWEKFRDVWVSKDALQTMMEVDAIQKRLQHKPFNSKSEAHQKFLQNLDMKIKRLQSQYPQIYF